MKPKRKVPKKLKNFANLLAQIKIEAGKLELWETMHALDFPQKAIINDIMRLTK